MLIRRLARPMLATMFIAGGVDTLRNPGGRPHAAAPLIAKGEQILPDRITDNIPTNPDTLVKINAAVQLGGGLLLASGRLPRMASLALAGSLVPTTLAGHAFWEETDPAVKSAQRIQFLKNVSLLGGLLIAAVDTEGKPSLGWRSRRAAKRANRVVTVAQRMAASDTTRQLSASRSELAHAARVRASHLSAVAAERGTELAHAAAQRGGELAQIATDRGPVLAAQVRDLGAELADQARDRTAEFAKESAKKRRKAGRRGRH